MPKSKPLTDENGKVRELSAADMKRLRPVKDALPSQLLAKLNVGGVQKAPTKERITIRLSPKVVTPFRATGDGWQTRVDAVLKDWLKSHKPAEVEVHEETRFLFSCKPGKKLTDLKVG